MPQTQLITPASPRGLFGVLIIALAAFSAADVRGANDPDAAGHMDSLVYQSDLVIEGRLTEPNPSQRPGSANVRITAVYYGPAKVGESIVVVGISDFRKLHGAGVSTIQLGPKDQLFFFLKMDRDLQASDRRKLPPDAQAFVPVNDTSDWDEPSARLFVRGHVYAFSQMPLASAAPSRTVWQGVLATRWLDAGFDSVPDFRNAVRSSASASTEWHAHLDRPPVMQDIPWLLSLLKQRYASRPHPTTWPLSERDRVADTAALRLASLHDLSAIDQAIAADPDQASAFKREFTSPQGRDFLLNRLRDRSLAMAHRKLLAEALSHSGGVYRSLGDDPATGPMPEEKDADPKNSSYLTRIAKLAADLSSAGDDELAVLLVRILESQAFRWRNSQFDADLHDAAEVLRTLYAGKNIPPALQFEIERAVAAIDEKEYAMLQSKCGPIMTLVQPPLDGTQFGLVPGSNLVVNCHFYRPRPYKGKITATKLVAEPVGGGDSYVLASSITIPAIVQNLDVVGSDIVALPPNFKPGRYRLSYRLMNGQQIVSEGHGFETALPQQFSPVGYPAFTSWSFSRLTVRRPWPRWRFMTIGGVVLAVPMWLVLRALVRSRRQYRRTRRGQCMKCAYDLRFTRARCPECGTPASANPQVRILRRCLTKISIVASAVIFLAATALWIRSYRTADCYVRTAADRADSAYCSRGALVFNLRTTEGEPGWTYDHGDPLAFPRSTQESGDLAKWSVLGIEYSSIGEMVVVPMWVPTFVSLLLAIILIRKLRRWRRATVLRNIAGTAS